MLLPMSDQGEWHTVKQLSRLAGVSTRTLHYYDEIGLLRPTRIAANGYRQYDRPALLRLQQIRFYRELGLNLDQIRQILSQPGFDPLQALEIHWQTLQAEADRLRILLATLDQTILHLKGKTTMTNEELFSGFTPEQEQAYEAEARRRWGDEQVTESSRRWNAYSAEERRRILNEGGGIYRELEARLSRDPASPEVQALIARWHEHLRYFYEPTPEILRGLGRTYAGDPAFAEFFAGFDPGLPDFMHRAIDIYCSRLAPEG
jgi:MerR family transcriptional regulator, thiopeptide resistance regulator